MAEIAAKKLYVGNELVYTKSPIVFFGTNVVDNGGTITNSFPTQIPMDKNVDIYISGFDNASASLVTTPSDGLSYSHSFGVKRSGLASDIFSKEIYVLYTIDFLNHNMYHYVGVTYDSTAQSFKFRWGIDVDTTNFGQANVTITVVEKD